MSKLYLPEGWINLAYIEQLPATLIFIYGGRGIGKTYAIADGIRTRWRGHAFLMRRTMTEWRTATADEFNTFSRYNKDLNRELRFKRLQGAAEILDGEEYIGLSAPMSTFSNLRGAGFDAYEQINVMYYDEFIPERHKAKIRDEADVFLNVYESINRNRELFGEPPLKCICTANSNQLENALFMGLDLVNVSERMKRKGQELSILEDRGIALVDCRYSPISKRKAETALYRATQGTEFYHMAIENTFNDPLFPSCSRPLVEYKPVVNVGDICIYKHKSNGRFYVSGTHQKAPAFQANEQQLAIMRTRYDYLYDIYYAMRFDFESNKAQLLFLKYFNI